MSQTVKDALALARALSKAAAAARRIQTPLGTSGATPSPAGANQKLALRRMGL